MMTDFIAIDLYSQVSKLVHAIKMGWMKLPSEIEADRKRKEEEEKRGPKFYDLWG